MNGKLHLKSVLTTIANKHKPEDMYLPFLLVPSSPIFGCNRSDYFQLTPRFNRRSLIPYL